MAVQFETAILRLKNARQRIISEGYGSHLSRPIIARLGTLKLT